MDVPHDLRSLKKALRDAGFEVYRARGDTIELAERIRLHIMDSGVYVVLGEPPEVRFVSRCQRSDFPAAEAEELFSRVRMKIGGIASQRGFDEVGSHIREVRDPVDPEKVLDVWHEVTFAKSAGSLAELLSAARWAISAEKYVGSA